MDKKYFSYDPVLSKGVTQCAMPKIGDVICGQPLTIDEVQSMRLRRRIGFILINDFAERRWVGDVFFMLTLQPSIASPAPSRADNNDKCCSSSDIFCHKHSHSHHTCNTSIFYHYLSMSSQDWVQGQEMSVAV